MTLSLPEDVHSLIWRHYFSNVVLPDLPAPAELSIYEPIPQNQCVWAENYPGCIPVCSLP